jgi:hypothetical protein
MRRVYLQADGLAIDPLVVPCNACRLILNLPLNLLKVIKHSARYMVKLCPFSLCGDRRRRMRYVDVVIAGLVVFVARNIDELQYQWSSGNDSGASGEKVTSNDVF